MDRVEVEAFEQQFAREIAIEDDSTAKSLLAAGRAIYVSRDDTPPGHVVRVFPDGRSELVLVDHEKAAAILGR